MAILNSTIVNGDLTVNESITQNDAVKNMLLDLVYPIGSIYMSVNNVSPATFLGGYWLTWGEGRVPVSVDTTQTEFATVEETGGEKTHILTKSEMPAHSHSFGVDTTSGSTANSFKAEKGTGYTIFSVDTVQEGGGSAHNNLQPYITCYMWKRVNYQQTWSGKQNYFHVITNKTQEQTTAIETSSIFGLNIKNGDTIRISGSIDYLFTVTTAAGTTKTLENTVKFNNLVLPYSINTSLGSSTIAIASSSWTDRIILTFTDTNKLILKSYFAISGSTSATYSASNSINITKIEQYY